MEQENVPSDAQVQARAFADCFEPSAYKLDKRFGWMDEEHRSMLGEKAVEALEQAYIETMNEIYG